MRKDKYKEFEKAKELEQKKKTSAMAVWGRRRRGARRNGITISKVLPAAGKLNQNVTALGILDL